MKQSWAVYVFSALWLFSAYAWISNTIFQIHYFKNYAPLFALTAFLLLALILYFVEGMEIAYGDLRDKEAEQLRDESTREFLHAIQERSQNFFSQRQVFAVSIISLISIFLSGTVNELAVYGVGIIQNPYAAITTFAFANIFILCFCQILPKHLAVQNSEKFLSGCRTVWRITDLIGRLNISAPADYFAPILSKILGYKARNLRPSRASLFNSMALAHGYCTDQRSISIELNKDGSAKVELCYLVLFLHGRRQDVAGRYRVGLNGDRYIDKVEIMGAWKLSPVEDLKSHEECLDNIFAQCGNGAPLAEVCANEKLTPIKVRHKIEMPAKEDRSDAPDWRLVFLDQLPEGLYGKQLEEDDILALLYKATGHAPAGSFYVGKVDAWSEKFATACRKMIFSLNGSGKLQIAVQDCEVKLENPVCLLPEESRRAWEGLRETSAIIYPILAASYAIKFDSMIEE